MRWAEEARGQEGERARGREWEPTDPLSEGGEEARGRRCEGRGGEGSRDRAGEGPMVKMVRGGEGGGVEGSRVRGAEGARGRRVRVGEAGGEEVWRRSCVLLDGFPWLMLQYVGRLLGGRRGGGEAGGE